MNQTITTEDAIKKGHLVLTVPALIIMFGTMVVSWFLVGYDHIPFFFGPMSFLLGPILGVLFACFNMANWRIWSYERITNLIEFKEEAIHAGLIFKDHSFLMFLEIRSELQKARIQELEKRLKSNPNNGRYFNDPSIPAKTEFRYLKGILVFRLISGISVAVFFIFFLFMIDIQNNIGKSILIFSISILMLISAHKAYIKLREKGSTLILSNDGITVNRNFYDWHNISNETAQMKGFGQDSAHFMIFEYKGEIIEVALDDYNQSSKTLRRLLRVYRERNIEFKN